MNKSTSSQIRTLISSKIDEKLTSYEAETEYKPFFEAIFSRQTITMASIMQSLYTSFGMSIYEQMAQILAKEAGYSVQRQYDLKGTIDDSTENLINKICQTTHGTPDKKIAMELIRNSIKAGSSQRDDEGRVDVFLVKNNIEEFYIDISTVKPNMKEFRAMRRKMLRWCALRFSQKQDAQISTYIGIPYNPYYPDDYARWEAIYDPGGDILVQNELWKCFAGYDVFDELLGIFQEVGLELREKVDTFLTGPDSV